MLKFPEHLIFPLAKNLTRYQKRFLLATSDLILLNFALWLAMSLRYGEFYVPSSLPVFGLLVIIPIVAVSAFFYFGLYRHVTRHFNAAGDKLIVGCIAGASVFLGLGTFVLGAEGVPRAVLLIFPLLGVPLISGSRRIVGRIIARAGVSLPPPASPLAIHNVVIYGASELALQLITTLRTSPDHEAVAIVDPDPTMWRQLIAGIRVFPPDALAQVISSNNVSQVLLATQNSTRKERLEVLNRIGDLPVDVRVVPHAEDIVSGRLQVSDLRPVDAADLLGRAPIPPDPQLMIRTIQDRTILVTGAGGSIGSELVRQIIKYHPRRLILLEASESALYEIESQVGVLLRKGSANGTAPDIVSILGSVLDQNLIDKTLSGHRVESVFHAAAYKHLPIVERNIAVGARNNVTGTEVVARAAARHGVASVVLISTDKAVRPTSVMGASKRVAELIFQALAREGGGTTTFSIVRFGNVLDSSGSVVPLFRKQIEAGGPLTVTHPEAVRYFISIPEAAELVIQASAMATGGEVFALDMGEPVKITDLARMMIRLSGLQLRDAQNPDGQIEIRFTGLRPGEKLAEELYISDGASATAHPRIHRIEEPAMSPIELWARLEDLSAAVESDDVNRVKDILFAAAGLRRVESAHAAAAGKS